ncbi:MAG: type I restriction enzyme HsdR N-terminal domain-containing protein, partial [Bacteroidaceae bacterium]|nr:type I restriction enzyme HsdR N-terminal domain-containing protein [Bacteroidaceae bacterium]
MMQPLNLPPFEANIKKTNGMVQIQDVLRHKFDALTPEEWVRQHFVNFLIAQKGSRSTLLANAVAVTLNG